MRIRTVLILLGFIVIPFLLRGQGAESPPDVGYLTVLSGKPGLSVLLNDRKAGETPLIRFSVKPGMHRVRIVDGSPFVWTGARVTETVSVEPGQTTEITIDMPASHLFDSTPYGADVVLNGTAIGRTPLSFESDAPVHGTVQFKKNGYADRVVPIEPGSPVTHGDLTIKPNFKKKLNENLNLEKEKSVDRRLLYSTLVLGTLSGAIAAYCKIEADGAAKKTERAAELGDLNGVQKYSDRTDRYDLYSGISFGIMQVNFIGLIYAVLK